jgi:hypothetical protein
MSHKEMIQEKIGLALGLETAAQKTVETLHSRGLLKPGHMKRISKMRNEQEFEMQDLVQELSDSDRFDFSKVKENAVGTVLKTSLIMETYLGGDNPDTQEALEFLCLMEGVQVINYKVLKTSAKVLNNKRFQSRLKSILREKRGHLDCTKLAKRNALSE